MSATSVNTHLGKNIEWTVYRNGHNELECALTLDGDPYDISDLTFTAYFRTPEGSANKLTLSEGASGLTNGAATGILTIPLSETSIESLPRDRYFLVVEYDLDSETYPLIQGYVTITSETNPGTTTSSVTIPVNISGVTVSMAVTIAGRALPFIYASSAVADGSTDNHTYLQALLTANVGKKIIIGRDSSDVYIISKPLIPPTGSVLEINGTLKLKDTSVRSLTANAALGATTISVANASTYFSVGQWVIISDDNKAVQGGGAWMTERVSDGNYVSAVTSTTITLRTALITAFTTAANAIVAHGQSVILLDEVDDVVITGSGIIDNNSNTLARLNPTNENGINESVRQMCGISVETCDNIKIDGVTIKNAALHGLVLHNVSNSDIRNLTIDQTHGKAVLSWNLSNSVVDNINCTNSYNEDGFSMYNGNYNLNLSNIRSSDARRYGFALIGADNENININGLAMDSNQIDVWIQTAENVNVSNIVITGTNATSQNTPLTISESSEVTVNNVIINAVTATRALAISGSATRNIYVNNLTINEMATTTAVTVASTCENVFIDGAIIQDVSVVFECTGGSPDNVVFRNSIFEDYTTFCANNVKPKFIKCAGDPVFVKASTATIANGKTSVSINHGLDITPIKANIKVTSTSTLGSAKHFWVSYVDAISFRIKVDVDPAEDITFNWVISDDFINDETAEVTYTENYASDFSAGVDSWASTRVTASGNNDAIFSEDNVLKVYADATAATHEISKAVASNTNINRVSFKYYIPSGQTNVNGLRVYGNTFTETVLDLSSTYALYDQWVEVTSEEWTANATTVYFRLLKTFSTSYAGANSSSDDIIYLKDISVEYR